VAEAKARWRRRTARTNRLWVPTPWEHFVIDWGEEDDLCIFCAVLAWSRHRFVRFAHDQRRETTLSLLAECFDELGGAPAAVLSDRMACLKAGVVANVVVPHPDYVRFDTHFSFRPEFCEAADPESKGVVGVWSATPSPTWWSRPRGGRRSRTRRRRPGRGVTR
jgi:transposase